MKRIARAAAVFVSCGVGCGSGGAGAKAPTSEPRLPQEPASPPALTAASPVRVPRHRDEIPARAGPLRGTADVLSVTAGETEGTPGSAGEWIVHLQIGPDYHVMSNRPSSPNYIPMSVEVSGPPGVKFREALYSPAATYRVEDQEQSAFRGNVDIAVPFTVSGSVAEGDFELRGKVHYQACTEGRCLFPRDEPFRGTLRVRPLP